MIPKATNQPYAKHTITHLPQAKHRLQHHKHSSPFPHLNHLNKAQKNFVYITCPPSLPSSIVLIPHIDFCFRFPQRKRRKPPSKSNRHAKQTIHANSPTQCPSTCTDGPFEAAEQREPTQEDPLHRSSFSTLKISRQDPPSSPPHTHSIPLRSSTRAEIVKSTSPSSFYCPRIEEKTPPTSPAQHTNGQ